MKNLLAIKILNSLSINGGYGEWVDGEQRKKLVLSFYKAQQKLRISRWSGTKHPKGIHLFEERKGMDGIC